MPHSHTASRCRGWVTYQRGWFWATKWSMAPTSPTMIIQKMTRSVTWRWTLRPARLRAATPPPTRKATV